ncbi:MAG: hypothetical protein EAZ07_01740 [Cytophagales bacterium]|nr:MAG: hypothetical protein EAZ07_01740 [Cytophagales bacterium]
MAKASFMLVDALRKTAKNIQSGKPYEWGHMGSCNCGNLAQTLLNISKGDIHRYAMDKLGDWSEQLNDYCPTSGLPMDQLISGLLQKGLSTDDLKHLEYLTDVNVIKATGRIHLRNNILQDVVDYMNAWANLLESELLSPIYIGFKNESKPTTHSDLSLV